MQAIAARHNSGLRVDLPIGPERLGYHFRPHYAPDGSPWVVVEDGTDLPARADEGYCWVIGIDDDNYGRPVHVEASAKNPGVLALAHYLDQNSLGWDWVWFGANPTDAPPTSAIGEATQC